MTSPIAVTAKISIQINLPQCGVAASKMHSRKPMLNFSPKQEIFMDHLKIHSHAVRAADAHRKSEMDLLNALEVVWRNKTYYQFGCRSLFEYSTKQLKLSEEMASIVNKIAKKFTELPELKLEMQTGELSLSKVNRITGVVNKDNVQHWVDLAKGTKRNFEKEIAKVQPEKAIPERARYQKADETLRVSISFSITQEEYAVFERTRDLLSQKLKRPASIGETHVAAIHELNQKLDPLKKPIRKDTAGTTKLTVNLKRKVHYTFDSQCTHVDHNGERCTQRRHLDIHHIVPKASGGTDNEANLTLLCAGHHRAHHRMKS